MTGYQSELADPRDIFWGYQDVGLFFLALSFLDAALRLAVRLRFMSPLIWSNPHRVFCFSCWSS
jgi:hypothetical protein